MNGEFDDVLGQFVDAGGHFFEASDTINFLCGTSDHGFGFLGYV